MESSLSTDRVRKRCLFCWTQKAFFYDSFCCWNLEFYTGQLKTRKTIYGQSSLHKDRVRNRCLFCWTQKAFFYDSFCCWSLEFQKEISRKRSHNNCLKTSVQRKTDIWTMSPNEQLRLSHKNWGKVKSVTVSRCCHGYVDLENLSFFATQICTLQAGTVLVPTLFEAFLPVVFKYWRVGVVIDCSRPSIFP